MWLSGDLCCSLPGPYSCHPLPFSSLSCCSILVKTRGVLRRYQYLKHVLIFLESPESQLLIYNRHSWRRKENPLPVDALGIVNRAFLLVGGLLRRHKAMSVSTGSQAHKKMTKKPKRIRGKRQAVLPILALPAEWSLGSDGQACPAGLGYVSGCG